MRPIGRGGAAGRKGGLEPFESRKESCVQSCFGARAELFLWCRSGLRKPRRRHSPERNSAGEMRPPTGLRGDIMDTTPTTARTAMAPRRAGRRRAGCATASCAARSPRSWTPTRARTRPGRSPAACPAARRARSRTRCTILVGARPRRPRRHRARPLRGHPDHRHRRHHRPADRPHRHRRPPPPATPTSPRRPRPPPPPRDDRAAPPADPATAPHRHDRSVDGRRVGGRGGGVRAGAPPGRAAVSPAAGLGHPGRDRAAQAARGRGARAAVRAARHREDLGGRGRLRRPDHRARGRGHHGRGPGRRVHPNPRRAGTCSSTARWCGRCARAVRCSSTTPP